MNLKTLSSEAMLSNSKEWLDNAELRRALEAHPLGSAILIEIRTTHDRLSGTVSERKLLDDSLRRLTAALDLSDGLHDRKARGLDKIILGLIEASDDPEEIAMLTKAREMLFPDGLQVVQWSYADEHGAVVEMENRLTAEVRALLARTRVGDTTLLAIYQQWVAAGMRLGDLAKERARLRATVKRSGTIAPSVDTGAARFEWVRVTQVFLSIVALLPLDDEVRRALLAPLERDVAQSLQNRARRAAANEQVEPGEPAETVDETQDELLEDSDESPGSELDERDAVSAA